MSSDTLLPAPLGLVTGLVPSAPAAPGGAGGGAGGAGGRAEQVAAQLETAVCVGLLSAGTRLPPERELAEQLGVTVLQLRQALAILRERGIITTRRGNGGGSFVADASAVSREEVAARLRGLSTEWLRDLGDLSGSITASACRLAAERADATDIDRLRELATAFVSAASLEQLRLADSRLHIAIAGAAQSRRLTAASVQVRGEVSPLLWHAVDGELPTAAAVEHHTAIVEAIARGDADAARRAGLLHSEQETRHVIEAHLAEVLTEATSSPHQH
ncbi:transcriptional regulator, GntR family [Quadrisphaera granulorum]|uniref:GntR family transcriptional regulator n=1 Tax=Quadrisphaera granulorum TaxID=317664 RepID=A0A316A8P3_9ACTN|nr:FCD domain-containing protein [Quadrisphaera granulorum]PWJ54115.1 GntR family transcriptional regulator [Quadrisphaera granulorum]SZE96254.1 transcriptional regulator, GntR family [Quadrisphaera granulorum]